MASFDIYTPRLLRWEGGFVDNPMDPGGATCKGVTLTAYRQHFGSYKTKEDLRGIHDWEWREVMKRDYWDKCKGDLIANQSVAEIFVDWCINSGVGMIRKVQTMLGTPADGIVGPKTVALINRADFAGLHAKIWKAREAYFNAIVDKRPSSRIFLRGWMNRLTDFVYSE